MSIIYQFQLGTIFPVIEVVIESFYHCFDINLQLAFAICSCHRHIQDTVSMGMVNYTRISQLNNLLPTWLS